MTTTTTTLLILMHQLRQRGFTPNLGGLGEDWYDLNIGSRAFHVPQARIRVQDDDGTISVYAMTGNGVLCWDVKLANAPLNVVTAVIDLAIAYGVTAGADEEGR